MQWYGKRRRTVETVGELTTQEAQVARLAAQGLRGGRRCARRARAPSHYHPLPGDDPVTGQDEGEPSAIDDRAWKRMPRLKA